MNRILFAGLAFVVWTVAAVAVGWQWRDARADAAEALAGADRVAAVEDARSIDRENSASADAVERERVDARASTETQFKVIEREVVRYVQANPDPDGCDLDGDGLRAWRAANAGGIAAEPGGLGGAAGDPSGAAAAARER